jgi:hypothetical protein
MPKNSTRSSIRSNTTRIATWVLAGQVQAVRVAVAAEAVIREAIAVEGTVAAVMAVAVFSTSWERSSVAETAAVTEEVTTRVAEVAEAIPEGGAVAVAEVTGRAAAVPVTLVANTNSLISIYMTWPA